MLIGLALMIMVYLAKMRCHKCEILTILIMVKITIMNDEIFFHFLTIIAMTTFSYNHGYVHYVNCNHKTGNHEFV